MKGGGGGGWGEEEIGFHKQGFFLLMFQMDIFKNKINCNLSGRYILQICV